MINQNIYDTAFTNFAPQRGFLASTQDKIFITDVDIFKEKEDGYNLLEILDRNNKFYFSKSGPPSINLCKPFIKFNFKNKAQLNNFRKLKVYLKYYENNKYKKIKKINYKLKTDKTSITYSFPDLNKFIPKIKNDYKIENNQIVKNNNKTYQIVFSCDAKIINLNYGLRALVCQHDIKNELELLNLFSDIFAKEELSGRIYRTQKGFRIILTDRFLDLSKHEQRIKALDLMNKLLSDQGYIRSMIVNNLYLARLSPKAKNYKKLNNKYENFINKIKDSEIFNLCLDQENVIPIKYDFEKIYFPSKRQNLLVKKNFTMLKSLIKQYLASSKYGVCRLVKEIGNNNQPKEIKDFIYYHDLWTKANKTKKYLI